MLGDEYALLSFVWCEAMRLPLQQTGVLVRPAQVREWLQECFVTKRQRRAYAREALMKAFHVKDENKDPYASMLQSHGPGFLSITRMCNPGDTELKSVVTVPDEVLQESLTSEHPGFDTWRVQQVTVTAPLPMQEVLRLMASGFKEAMKDIKE